MKVEKRSINGIYSHNLHALALPFKNEIIVW